MKRVTVNDIANHLNIAQSTVSKAMADKPGISIEMKEKIWAAAEEMGYSANRLAQGLAKKPIDIGVIMPSVWPEYYGLINDGIQQSLQQYNDFKFNVIYRYLSKLNNESELEQCIDELIGLKAKVIILCPVFNTSCSEYLSKLKENNVQLILLGTDLPDCDRIACVKVDAKKAGALAGEFSNLVMHKSKKIAILVGNRCMQEHEEKLQGFSEMLSSTECTIVGTYETQDIPEIASIITKKLLEENQDLEAIYVATSNSIAVCQTLDEIDPNNEVKVIATDVFKEIERYFLSNRIIGVIYQDPKRMGKNAVHTIFEYFYEGEFAHGIIQISPLLVMHTNLNDFI